MAKTKPAAKAAKKAAPAAKKKPSRAAAAAPSAANADDGDSAPGGATDVVRSTLPIADTAGQAPATSTAPAVAEPDPPAPPAQMPLYKSHKKVRAAKIESVRADWAEQGVHVEGIGLVRMGDEWMARHKPAVGGYLVEYEDGYQSFSPAEAFESGYTLAKA